ncbi:SgcJ/EcaC family oxidoreductase [Amycolatopsis japonica]|uniref:SgcJ/EcaC family oxidoreductase n=1 Tax=Amycolatopsis japonica TaxID=208439 RepID=UPI003329314B
MSESDEQSTVASAAVLPEPERMAAQSSIQRVIDAWAAHDAQAFAEAFTPDGSMILPGVYAHGRAQIRFFMASAFAVPYFGTRVTGAPIEVKVLSPNVVVFVNRGGVLAPGDRKVTPERAIRATWVVVKHDSRWQIAVYQNCPAGTA